VLIIRRSNCIILHVVSSHSVGGRPVRTGRPPTERDDTRCCIIQFDLLMMSTIVLETCRGIMYTQGTKCLQIVHCILVIYFMRVVL